MRFEGWPPEAIDWLQGLEADNSKAYFTATRPVYERAVRGPLEALVAALAAEFGQAKVFRPNRDVRFSADKSPYKTNAAAVIGTVGGAAFYVELSADGLLAGSGYHGMARDQLERYRAAVDAPDSGQQLVGIVAALERDGLWLMGQALKTAPRGYPRDHPRVGLLRHKDVLACRDEPPGGLVHSPAALDWVADTWRAAAGLNRWLDRHVGASSEPPARR